MAVAPHSQMGSNLTQTGKYFVYMRQIAFLTGEMRRRYARGDGQRPPATYMVDSTLTHDFLKRTA